MAKPTAVFLSIGSNIEREKHITLACQTLKHHFPSIQFSNIFDTPALGFEGSPFYNLCARFESLDSKEAICQKLKGIETEINQGQYERLKNRAIDIDVILLGDEQLKDDMTHYPFILKGFAQLDAKFQSQADARKNEIEALITQELPCNA